MMASRKWQQKNKSIIVLSVCQNFTHKDAVGVYLRVTGRGENKERQGDISSSEWPGTT